MPYLVMPRIARVAPGGQVYHVINRANGRLRLFRKPRDFEAFYDAIEAAMVPGTWFSDARRDSPHVEGF
jgi:hypothetical protein